MVIGKILSHFQIKDEREDVDLAIKNINDGIAFQGTNLWILIFAIFIASLGLNVNSTAVIIGAMLISPLMGPIIGIGMSVGINDLQIFRRAIANLLIAIFVGLATSTVYFLISPLNHAHAELLARTTPTIYDVLIALFGGFAGTLATFSKKKGNVIPGAAIATALMPPLCTAGYGLATLNFNVFFGAFYLFIINAVFIAYATLLTTRLLKFPRKHLLDAQAETKAKRIIAAIVLLTLVPSIYLGYDIIQRDQFIRNANAFIDKESALPNDYLLNKKLDHKTKSIQLIYGGKEISKEEIDALRGKMKYYNLEDAQLEVKQGFAYLNEDNESEDQQLTMLNKGFEIKDLELRSLTIAFDSVLNQNNKGQELFNELRVQYPNLNSLIFSGSARRVNNTSQANTPLICLHFSATPPNTREKAKISNWLRIRLKQDSLKVIFE